MPRLRHHRQREERPRRRTGLYLLIPIGLVLIIVLLLALQVGQTAWPAWLVMYRGQIIGVLGLFVLALLCAAPILIEAHTRTRHLSGPGHNPEQGWRSKDS